MKTSTPPTASACASYVRNDLVRTQERLRTVLSDARVKLSQETCPHCISPVNPAASVCATCRRDLPDRDVRVARLAALAREALAAWQAEAQRALIREELVVPALVAQGGAFVDGSARYSALLSDEPFGSDEEVARRHGALVAEHARELGPVIAAADPDGEGGDLAARLLRVAPFPFDGYAAEVQRQRRAAWGQALAESVAAIRVPGLPRCPDADEPEDTWIEAARAFTDRLDTHATFRPVLEEALTAAAVRYAGRAPTDPRLLLERMSPAPLLRMASVHRIPADTVDAVALARSAADAAFGETARVRVPWPVSTRQAVFAAWGAAVVGAGTAVFVPDLGAGAVMVLVTFIAACGGSAAWMANVASAAVDDRAGRSARDAFQTQARAIAEALNARNGDWREGVSAALAGRAVILEPASGRAAAAPPSFSYRPDAPLPPAVPVWARFAVAGAAVVVAVCVTMLAIGHRSERALQEARRAEEEARAQQEEALRVAEQARADEAARLEAERETTIGAALDAAVERGVKALQPALDGCRDARVAGTLDGSQPPFVGGRWRVVFVVPETGQPREIEVAPLATPDEAVQACLAAAVTSARFSPLARPKQVERELDFVGVEVASKPVADTVGERAPPALARGAGQPAPQSAPKEDPAQTVRLLSERCGRSDRKHAGSRWRVEFSITDGAHARNVRVSNILGDDDGLSGCLSAEIKAHTFAATPAPAFSTVVVGGGK